VFPTAGEPGVTPPVYEDVETAHVATPQAAFVPAMATQPSRGPALGAEPARAGGEYELQVPTAGAEAPTVPMMASSEMGSGELNDIRSMLYTFERKLADYEKRLHYIDKYTEMIQRQQNKKFKAQKELLALESRKGKWLGVGIGVAALTIGIVLLIVNWEPLIDLFKGLFGM